MKRRHIQVAVMTLLCVFLASCGGGGNGTNNTGPDSIAALSKLIAPGEVCPSGGAEIETGIDANESGVLDPNEVTNTEVICNGSDGFNSMAMFSTEPEGSNCELGGIRIDVGLDNDKDSLLEASEITDTDYLCAIGEVTRSAIVGAISTSPTTVKVSFSKAMDNSIADPSKYVITQEAINIEVGTLTIESASFPADGGEHYSIILTTSPQNEVTYRVKGSGLMDVDGKPLPGIIEVPGGTIDTTSTTFAGSAPSLTVINALYWDDVNANSIVDGGDIVSDDTGQQVILFDVDNDGVVENWNDIDNSGGVTPADTVTAFLDSDDDGLPDHLELYGATIIIELANGQTETVSVTSDPTANDSDGDGLNDQLELSIGSNPRRKDTDSDGLSDYLEWNVVLSDPNKQDSDSDGLIDGLEHDFYHTSPILADSDGDQLSDETELLELNRNPLVADLPRLQIYVGNVNLQIDERFSYVDETGETVSEEKSTSTSLENSQSTSFTRTDSHVGEWTVGASIRAGVGSGNFFGGGSNGFSGGAELTATGGYTDTTSWQTDATSASESSQALETSINQVQEKSKTSTVSREIVGASIDIDLMVENIGNLPFTIQNIEITVMQQVGKNDQLLPIATLVSNSELVTNTPLQINLGAFSNQRGPFIFSSREVFPNLVEALMRNPSGLVFRIANYDVVDELGRNYTFINQVARDRTAMISLDFGDAESASLFLVATNGARDDDQVAGGGYLGGFDPNDGSPKGLPMSYVLQNLVGIPRHNPAQDRITAGPNGVQESDFFLNLKGDDEVLAYTYGEYVGAGPNGWLETTPVGDDYIENPGIANGVLAGLDKVADSLAQGDDIQLIPKGTTGLSVGSIVIDPGENGILDTPQLSDDELGFINGYETSRSCSATANKPGDICRIDTDCQCQAGDTDLRCTPPAVVEGSCSGPQRLIRVNSLRNGDYNRGWVVLSTGNIPTAADFDQIIVNPGDDLQLAFVQDLDNDGLFARNEFLSGSTDSTQDHFNNAYFGENFNPQGPQDCLFAPPACDGIPDSKDSDTDGLGDYSETLVGWKVDYGNGRLRDVFSSPRFADTDGDGLKDPVEKDLSRYCQVNDSRIVALCVPNSSTEPATDPASPDTDQDGLSDFLELDGFAAGLAIVDGGNGIAESERNGDDIQRVFMGNPVSPGGVLILPGQNGIIDSPLKNGVFGDDYSINIFGDDLIHCGSNETADTVAQGDDEQINPFGSYCVDLLISVRPGDNGVLDTVPNNVVYNDDIIRLATGGLVTDPLRPDTDGDGFADGVELKIGSNPTVFDADDFTDQDLDGLTDNEESLLGWLVSVDKGTPILVKSSLSLPDTDFDGLPDIVERDLRTNPNKPDTDDDGLTDYEEVANLSKYTSLSLLYPGLGPIPSNTGGYGTNPTLSDSDEDSLSDKQELVDGFDILIPGSLAPIHVYTNAMLPDTDLDGRDDGQEINRPGGATNPTLPDTDSDGRSDGAEDIAGSDPFVADRVIRVRYTNLQLTGGGSDWAWSMYTQAPEQNYPGNKVTDVFKHHQNTDVDLVRYELELLNPSFGNRYLNQIISGYNCGYITQGNLTNIWLGSYTDYRIVVKQGDTVTLSGNVKGYSSCSDSSGIALVQSVNNFRKTITFDEISNGTGLAGVIDTKALFGSEKQEIGYEIIIE